MGLAAASALARARHTVVVHEQFDLDHARGSSHGFSDLSAGLSRRAVVALAQEALVGWRELEHETGEELLVLDGLLEVGETSEAALDACGVAGRRSSRTRPREGSVSTRTGARCCSPTQATFGRIERGMRSSRPAASRCARRAGSVARRPRRGRRRRHGRILGGEAARARRNRAPVVATRDGRVLPPRAGTDPSLIEYGRGPAIPCTRCGTCTGSRPARTCRAVRSIRTSRLHPTRTSPRLAALCVRALPGRGTRPAALDTCLYTSTRRVRPRAARPDRRRIRVLRPRLQVRTRSGKAACGPRFGSTMRFSEPSGGPGTATVSSSR